MNFYDTAILLLLFLIFIGFALLVYLQFFQLIARLHFKLLPWLAERHSKNTETIHLDY